MARDAIRVEELEVSCVVGVYPEEREREQVLRVSVSLGLDLARAGLSAELAASCDYARVADEIAALLQFRRYGLLEAAAEETAAMLLALHPAVEVAQLRLDKPGALRGRARAAGVTITRGRADFPRRRESAEFGAVETVLQTAEASLQVLHVAPQRAWASRPGPGARELVFRVEGELSGGGGPIAGLGVDAWAEGHVHEYRNEGADTARLFRCVHARAAPEIGPV